MRQRSDTMYTAYYDMHKDNYEVIENEFEISMDKKVRCRECGWHGEIKDTKIRTVNGELSGLVCPRCLGVIEDE